MFQEMMPMSQGNNGGGVYSNFTGTVNTLVTEQLPFTPTKVLLWWRYLYNSSAYWPQLLLLDVQTGKYYMWWTNKNGEEVTGWEEYFYIDGSTIYFKQPDGNINNNTINYMAIKE